MPTFSQPPPVAQLGTAASTRVPNIKDIPELTGREKFPLWLQRTTGELRRLALYNHVADPKPGSELDYVPGEEPTYMPDPITRNADDTTKAYVKGWYENDGLCHYIVTAKLSPAILADVPKQDERREGRPACARTVWNYLRDHFGGGDANAVMIAWDRVKMMKALTDQEVGSLISSWESAYNEMALINKRPPLDTILSALTVALPHTVLFMPMKYKFADRVRKCELGGITASSIFADIKSALRLVPDNTSSSKPKSKNPRNDRGSSGTSNSGSAREKEVCDNCKRTGHVEAKCWAPGGPLHGKEAQIQKILNERKAAKAGKSSEGTAAVNIAPPTATIEEVKDSGGGGSKLAGVVFTNLPEYDSYDAYLACVSMSSRPDWLPDHLHHLLDSGCSRHIFNDKTLFWEYRDLPTSSMSTANCGQLDIVGCGTVRLMVTREDGRPFLINLKDCRYAPGAALNLISVGMWQKAGIAVNFTPHGTICSIEERCVSFKAEKFDTLSFVGGEIIYPGQDSLVMAAMTSAVAPAPLTWHYRLGHLGMDDTRKALSGRWARGVKTSGSWPKSICPPCIIDKGARQPLTKPANRATTVLELLHVDICGPFPISSNSGEHPGKHQYWISILDDWSSYGYVQPLPDQSGERLVKVFDQLVTRWERRNGQLVKKIRFDGALELSAGELRKYFVQ